MILKSSTIFTRMFVMRQSSDHYTGKTGAAPAVTLSKAGAAFAAAGGTVTELTSGWYKIALTSTDTNTPGELAYHITGTASDPLDFSDQVQAFVFNDLAVDSSGNVSIASNIKKNQALSGFVFAMTSSTTHEVTTGLSVTAQRSLAGAGFAACANSVSELSNGCYSINLAAADLNANTVMLRFTATLADDLNILILTQP